MKSRIRRIVASVTAVTVLASAASSIQAATWMEDFYSDAGASINVTPGGTYATQANNVISGGGFVVRAPRKNVQLLSVTPPGLKTGCGGIDFWAGSFGFINKEQLVAFLRNIGQNALGLFFQLALKSMAPEVAATIEVMQDWAQRMNQFNMNSCEAASALINDKNLSFLSTKDSEQRATAWKVTMGGAADRFLSSFDIKSNLAEAYSTNASAATAAPTEHSNTPQESLEGNATWEILKKVTDLDLSEKLLIISLIGTHIPKRVNDSNGDPTVASVSHPSIITIQDLIGDRVDDTEAKLYTCGADTTKCLTMVRSTATTSYAGFAKVAMTRMSNIRSAILSRTAQNVNDLKILDMTTLPVYRLIATSTSSRYPWLSQASIERYSDLVGLELALAYLDFLMTEVRRQMTIEMKNQTSAYKLYLDQIEQSIANQLESGYRLRMKMLAERGALTADITEIEHMERALYSNLSSNLAANLRFGKKM